MMHFVTAEKGDVVDVRTPHGTLSLIVMKNGEVVVRPLYEGDGSTQRTSLLLARTSDPTVTYAPRPGEITDVEARAAGFVDVTEMEEIRSERLR